jgi:hypothetical protein
VGRRRLARLIHRKPAVIGCARRNLNNKFGNAESVMMAGSLSQRKAQAAWERIEALGGGGVWDGEIVIVALSNTAVVDEDLVLFRDFPFVQTLDLSNTAIGDSGLAYLAGLRALQELVVIGTKISPAGVETFCCQHPKVNVVTEPAPKGAVNPFTGKAF